MSFYEVKFGTTDAETELLRTPEIFDQAFFDPDDNLDKIINGYPFIISGRKGDGKSAYSAKMKRESTVNSDLEVVVESLENINISFFDKFTESDLTGGKRYVPMWKCIILLELVKYLERRNFSIQAQNYNALVEALDKMGLLSGTSIENTITTLDSTEVCINVNNWVTYGHHTEKKVVIKGATDISNTLVQQLQTIYLGDSIFRIVLDGLDDILRSQKFRPEIITGLIRAASELNNTFSGKALNFKSIILVRTDILDKCLDPDISKIKTASSINLCWNIGTNPYESNLAALILARFNTTSDVYPDFMTMWENYFPPFIDGKDSLSYMLENTLYKPRDVLMFFSFAQKLMGKKDRKITEAEFKSILITYSEEYFYSYLQDELSGFLPDSAISELPHVISKIGSRRFDFYTFDSEIKKHTEFNETSSEEILKNLFDRGYIGQYRKRPDHPKDEFLFYKHINKRQQYEKDDDCVIHRGLIRAFGI